MKAKYALIALLTVTFFGCDDNTAELGLGMFPGSDQNINGKLTTFDVITSSIPTGRIYAKTNLGYVGKFTDPTFGAYNAGFLATLNCPTGLVFPAVYKEAADGKTATGVMVTEADEDITLVTEGNEGNERNEVLGNIHTVELSLWYNSYFGDSLAACRLSVFELDKELKLNNEKSVYYTDIVPELYGPNQRLGTKAYTAVDLSVTDSVRNLKTYVPSVHINFEKAVADRVGTTIMKASREAGSKFDTESFIKAFKGLYVKSDFGDGTVLYVFQVQMNVVFKRYVVDKETGLKLTKKVAETDGSFKDSTYYDYIPFISTREVIQANKLQNDQAAIDRLIDKDDCTYLKSPAGIFTQATLPVLKIKRDLEGDTLNAVKLAFSNYNQSADKKFGMSIPSKVMLIRKRFKDSFFEKNQLADGISSYLASHTSNTNQYTFSNVTKLINACIADREVAVEKLKSGSITLEDIKDENGVPVTVSTIEAWEEKTEWDKVVLIPVLVTYDSSSSNPYGEPNVISIQHDLKPGYVRLKGGSRNGVPISDAYKLKLEVVSTNFASTKSN